MDRTYLIAGGLVAFFLLQNKSGKHKPPNERWFDVPGVGITPEGMLHSVGYVFMPELNGYVSRAALLANGWILTNGVWDFPQGASNADYLVLAGSLLATVSEDQVEDMLGLFNNNDD